MTKTEIIKRKICGAGQNFNTELSNVFTHMINLKQLHSHFLKNWKVKKHPDFQHLARITVTKEKQHSSA